MGFKIIFIPLLDQGHLQMSIAIGKSLLFRDSSNKIYFITDKENHQRIKERCSQFNTLLYEPITNEQIQGGRKDNLDSCLMENKERFKRNLRNSVHIITKWKSVENAIIKLIKQIEPDLILVDNLCNLPFVMKYKWAMLISTNPLLIGDQINYPVICSGVAEKSKEYTDIWIECTKEFRDQFADWFKEYGLQLEPSLSYVQPSPYLNVFLYPKMLNYFEPEDLKGQKWTQLCSTLLKDVVNKFIQDQGWVKNNSAGKEILTTEFLNKPGKLILFSLGTIVSQNFKVFEKLMPIIADCPHKFIVSKGKLADQIKLPPNCVGAANLNQLELLPLVDLFVTHGGNNSFTEAFYFGTPMIIIPGYADQLDNACRLDLFGLGKSIFLRDVSKEKLCSAIDFVVNNETIKAKLKEISDQMKNDDAMEKLCDLILQTCSQK